jgi:hypothetical protein
MNNHMRQGQNNKRSRGRGGRKPQNSSNRAYDSNGPDVKIRGTATHVCEKYQQLARDAISAGDRVTAENYYQHAEHYYRLLMASQTLTDGQPRPQNNLGYRPQEDEEEEFDQAEQGGQQNFQPQQQRHQNYNPNQNQGGYQQGGHGQNFNNPNNQQPRQQNEPQQGMNGGGQPRPAPAFEGDQVNEQPGAPEGGFPSYGNDQAGGFPGGDGQRRRQGRRRRHRHDGGGGGQSEAQAGGPDEEFEREDADSGETSSS